MKTTNTIKNMRQLRPLPSSVELAPTLAQRVAQLRDLRNMTQMDVARRTRFSRQRIEDIESGIETWLSSTDRQLLAKALCVEPVLLQEVETQTVLRPPDNLASQDIAKSILLGIHPIACPNCDSLLTCSIQAGFGLEGEPIKFPKAFCAHCPFVLR
ncbi:MAG: helix-turn-helix domain-containing protein [Candidatus Melainabacteria bacterium]|nr:helix-turn-helix domain-containing protein [Candidatus Melainabacteria bacterium]